MSGEGMDRERMRRLLSRTVAAGAGDGATSADGATARSGASTGPHHERFARLDLARRVRPQVDDNVAVPAAYDSWQDWAERRHQGAIVDPRGYWQPELPPTVETTEGDLSILTTRFPMDHRHGCWSLGEVARRATTDLDALARDPDQSPYAWNGAAFLDIETTSLSTGSGVIVFLTGVGAFEDDEFVVRQYLMRTPLVEERCFSAIAQDLAARARLVTFFGKAFDQHRLQDRARFLALDLQVPRDHFDLYWMSKRLLDGKFRNLRLKTLEDRVLQFHRLRDLPGSEAPEAYFASLRGEGEEALQGVLLHNLLDIVSLPVLAAELSLRMEAPNDDTEREARSHVLARAGRVEEAIDALAELQQRDPLAQRALCLADWSRRLRRFEDQRRHLDQAVELEPDFAKPWVELAKWHEHRARDYPRALECCERARAGGATALEVREQRLRERLA